MQQALQAFTRQYCASWRQQTGGEAQSRHLAEIPSPCVLSRAGNAVLWRPCPFPGDATLAAVEQALEITLQPAAHQFYTTQLAADMPARFEGLPLTLLQTWSEDDFLRVQENLIGHLVTQRRLKLSPTVFIATLEHEDLQVISLCNLSGEVLLETLGTRQRDVLADSLRQFLLALTPDVLAV